MERQPIRAGDFRAAAVAASVSLRERMQRQGRGDPVAGGYSCCLPAEGDGPAVMRRARQVAIVSLVLGVLGLATAGAVALWVTQRYQSAPTPPLGPLIAAGCCTVGGIATVWIGLSAQKRMAAAHVRARLGATAADVLPIQVTVESTATYRTLKLLPEDFGLLFCDEARKCVRVEGLLFRHVIHAADVAAVAPIEGVSSQGLAIDYRIGEDVRLSITLGQLSPTGNLKQQVLESSTPLAEPVCRALGRLFIG